MDTSSQRFAIAALLEGRVGLVCDIHEHTPASHRSSAPRALSTSLRDSRASVYSSRASGEHIVTEATSPREDRTSAHQVTCYHGHNLSDRAMARAITEATLPEIYGAHPVRTSWTIEDPLLTPMSPAFEPFPSIPNISYIPIETGPRSIYRNLCSAKDPPRSVAICPQRRCVAFGCSAGIELHLIDALTGQDLDRWPSTAPSDFLDFLPPRPGVDSAKKLRLISSACHPKEQDGLQSRFLSSYDKARHHGMSWEDEGFTEPGGWDYTCLKDGTTPEEEAHSAITTKLCPSAMDGTFSSRIQRKVICV